MYTYSINQFLIESDICLPCDESIHSIARHRPQETLTIHYSRHSLQEFVEVALVGKREGGFLRSYTVGSGTLVCLWDDVRIHIDSVGGTITLDYDASDPMASSLAVACTINLGISICTLLHGQIPIHGASVELDGKLIGLMAPSGTGKSTLLWSLLDSGARFVCDDVLPISIQKSCVLGTPSICLPAKLSLEALESRGMTSHSYTEVYPGAEEFWIPIKPSDRLLEPRPLAALFLLRPVQEPYVSDEVYVRRCQGGEALSALFDNTQGLWAVATQLDAKCMLAEYLAVVRSVPIYVLAYPRRLEILQKLRSTIQELLRAEGESNG